jgi:hypothetical protein
MCEGYWCTGLVILFYSLHTFHCYTMFADYINQKRKKLRDYEAFLVNVSNGEFR